MRKPSSDPAQILLFPTGEQQIQVAATAQRAQLGQFDVVISGTYRKDVSGLRLIFEELKELGCSVLSPKNTRVVREVDGFVYMDGEEVGSPESIELRHLDCITRSQFVWLHAPEGYVGPSAALEVGFARAAGIPVFARTTPTDLVMQKFVRVVSSPSHALIDVSSAVVAPRQPALRAFQNYYRRVAAQRGYGREDARDCLVLMMEEVGELARAIRKRSKLQRHGGKEPDDPGAELADVFIYVVHLANIMHLDLADQVRAKELINASKFAVAQAK